MLQCLLQNQNACMHAMLQDNDSYITHHWVQSWQLSIEQLQAAVEPTQSLISSPSVKDSAIAQPNAMSTSNNMLQRQCYGGRKFEEKSVLSNKQVINSKLLS